MAFFSAEILGEIFNSAHRSSLLIDIWLTGDRILQSKLSSVITHVYLKRPFASKFVNLHLLSNFRFLRYLSLKRIEVTMDNASKWQSVLYMLPPTLETLRTDHSALFLQHPPLDPLPDYGRGPTNWIDLTSMLPSLTRLELHHSSRPEFHRFTPFNEADVAGLPTTLKELSVSMIQLCGPSFRLLPRSLERLEATLCCAAPFDGDLDGPPHLSYIALLVSPSTQLLQSLPPNVEIGMLGFDDWIGNLVGVLPTNVHSMQIDNYDSNTFEGRDSDWIGSVPRSVKSLICHVSSLKAPIDCSFILQLPPHLTDLTLHRSNGIFEQLQDAFGQGIDVSSLWPKTLLSLVVKYESSSKSLQVFPRTLTSLEVAFSTENSNIRLDSSHFPPNLIRCTFSTSQVTPLCIVGEDLPASLTVLGSTRRSGYPLYTRSAIDNKLPSLTELTFRMPQDPLLTDAPWVLSSRLVTLKMEQWCVEWLEALPPQLTDLSIRALLGVREALKTGSLDLFEHLPTSLRKLSLDAHSGAYGEELMTHSLASLSNLRVISLGPSFEFPARLFKHLPRSLRNIVVRLVHPSLRIEPLVIPEWLPRYFINER